MQIPKEFRVDYRQQVVVAKSGGDYISIQAAIDSITDASPTKQYVINVYPGIYDEAVTSKDDVHLVGITPTKSSAVLIQPTAGVPLTCVGTGVQDITNIGLSSVNAVNLLAVSGGVTVNFSRGSLSSVLNNLLTDMVSVTGSTLNISHNDIAYVMTGASGGGTHKLFTIDTTGEFNLYNNNISCTVAEDRDVIVVDNKTTSSADIQIWDNVVSLAVTHAAYSNDAMFFSSLGTSVAQRIKDNIVVVTNTGGGAAGIGYGYFVNKAGASVLSTGNYVIVTGFGTNYWGRLVAGTLNMIDQSDATPSSVGGTFFYNQSTLTSGSVIVNGTVNAAAGVYTLSIKIGTSSGLYPNVAYAGRASTGPLWYGSYDGEMKIVNNSRTNAAGNVAHIRVWNKAVTDAAVNPEMIVDASGWTNDAALNRLNHYITAAGHFYLGGHPNGELFALKKLREEITVLAALTTTDSTIQIPANSICLAVASRVTTVIPGPATQMDVGIVADPTRWGNNLAVAAGTVYPGLSGGWVHYPVATNIRLTFDLAPGAATGKVRIVVYYIEITPPTA